MLVSHCTGPIPVGSSAVQRTVSEPTAAGAIDAGATDALGATGELEASTRLTLSESVSDVAPSTRSVADRSSLFRWCTPPRSSPRGQGYRFAASTIPHVQVMRQTFASVRRSTVIRVAACRCHNGAPRAVTRPRECALAASSGVMTDALRVMLFDRCAGRSGPAAVSAAGGLDVVVQVKDVGRVPGSLEGGQALELGVAVARARHLRAGE